MEVKDLKAEIKAFNSKLEYDRRLTVIVAEIRVIRREAN